MWHQATKSRDQKMVKIKPRLPRELQVQLPVRVERDSHVVRNVGPVCRVRPPERRGEVRGRPQVQRGSGVDIARIVASVVLVRSLEPGGWARPCAPNITACPAATCEQKTRCGRWRRWGGSLGGNVGVNVGGEGTRRTAYQPRWRTTGLHR